MTPDLSIIIVTYNSRRDIEKCLASLQACSRGARVEIIVCDNASPDGTADLVAQHFPSVKIIRSAHNLGFGRANNLAAQHARGRFFLLLNPDTWVEEDLAAALVNFLDSHPEASGCAPQHLNPDGTRQFGAMRELPTVASLFYQKSGLAYAFPRSPRFGRYYMTWWDHNEVREVQQAGACLALRREVFQQVGGFDESYFMYFEDVELCHAVRAAGHRIFYLPHARVYHIGGQSARQAVSKNFIEFYRSMCRYFRKHHGAAGARLAKLIIASSESFKLLALTLTLPFSKLLPQPRAWSSRWTQWRGHARLLREMWNF